MLLDAWTAYFKRARDEGQGELIEDDDFDLEAILADLERKAEEAPPDDWEPVDTWDVAEVPVDD